MASSQPFGREHQVVGLCLHTDWQRMRFELFFRWLCFDMYFKCRISLNNLKVIDSENNIDGVQVITPLFWQRH